MSRKLRLAALILILFMVIVGIGTTTAFANEEPVTPVLMSPELGPEYYMTKSSETSYEAGKEVFSFNTTCEYTFFPNKNLKTEKRTLTDSSGSYKSIFEAVFDEKGNIVKQTLTETIDGKTTVTDFSNIVGDVEVPSTGDEPVVTTDSAGRPVSVKGDGWEEKMTYDANDNLTSEIRYENGKKIRTTTWTYDAQGHVITRTITDDSSSQKYVYSYDSNGRISGYDYSFGTEKYHAGQVHSPHGKNTFFQAERPAGQKESRAGRGRESSNAAGKAGWFTPAESFGVVRIKAARPY